MKLHAVMENLLQRQQRARQEMEARQQAPEPPGPTVPQGSGPNTEDGEPESMRIQRAQMAALAAMRAAAAGLSHAPSPGGSEGSPMSGDEEDEDDIEEDEAAPVPPARADEPAQGTEGSRGRFQELISEEEEEMKQKWEDEDFEDPGEGEDEEEDEEEDEDDYEEDEEDLGEEGIGPAGRARLGTSSLLPRKPPAPQPFLGDTSRLLGGQDRLAPGLTHPGTSQLPPQPQPPDHGDWTYEEQFKQLYELDGDPKRKEFLDDLFSFMQKRGTPVNRIPIMAKQVLDLYMLYVLVTEKGGLVEVINKKLWREITKGLNLPTSITSAAFTLRTQYMKYLYPYECEKRGLSNPSELQAAIDSNRREGRRQGFGGSLFAYSPGGAHSMLSSPKLQVAPLGLTASSNGGAIAPTQKIKKEEDSSIPITVPSRLPVSLTGHSVVAAQAAAVQAAAAQAAVVAQAAALEQLREKLESGEPPEKKMVLVADEQQRLMQRALQQNLLAMSAQLPMSIRINSQASENRQDSAMNLANTNGTNSISMSVEINGIMYTGVLFAQPPGTPATVPASTHNKGGSSSSSSSNSRGGPGGGSGSGGSSSSSGGGGSSGGSQAGTAGLSVPSASTSNNSLP
ncbi:AT-rich interactive domain-containing protein 3A [Notamacropus eugenii]|uniref:AT-rich interactive domain-containing protein 3A n=1 Tax=Notamacropus eugenii TaxID=9315 RepID=UPI003B6774FE